jgi:hypothetical protein
MAAPSHRHMLRDPPHEREEATLKELHSHRVTAEMLEQAAKRHEDLARDTSALLEDDERSALLEDVEALRAQARAHADIAEAAEVAESTTNKVGPILTAAALGTAFALPGGMMLGAAGVAVAPYLGIDPHGTAMRARLVRATLRRDTTGRFNFELREDATGIFIAQLHQSDVTDERSHLAVRDVMSEPLSHQPWSLRLLAHHPALPIMIAMYGR